MGTSSSESRDSATPPAGDEVAEGLRILAAALPDGDTLTLPRKRVWARLAREMESGRDAGRTQGAA